MITSMIKILTTIVLLVTCSTAAAVYDSSYEERIGKQLSEGEQRQDVLWLQSGGRKFISLYRTFSTEKSSGAAIILHGMGEHPDWPEIVNPLRTALPKLGWATLSVQLPVLAPEASIGDYGKTLEAATRRIQAAVQQLQDGHILNIVIIGYSFGAATAAQALGADKINAVKAFVGISMQAQQFLNPRLKLLKQLESINLPVLDIYGSRDTLEVLRGADDRRLAARKNGNSAYQQMVIDGADHYFTGLVDVLVKRIHGWLLKVSAAGNAPAGDPVSPTGY